MKVRALVIFACEIFGTIGVAIFATAAAGAVRAAQGTSAPQQPVRVATRLVQVDVIVLDKHGNPVTGLTKDDFAVLDNKSPQTIQLFSTETSQVLPGAAPLPPDTYSNEIQATGVPSNLTIILLDSCNTGNIDQAYMRSQIAKLLRTLRTEDRVALYTPGAHLHVLHEFTNDAVSLDASLKKYLGERAVDVDVAKSESMSLFNKNLEAASQDAGIDENQAFAMDHRHPAAEALCIIADHVGSLPGRKNLLWVSGSFPFRLEGNNLQRTADGQKIPYATDVELTMRALTEANVAVYPVDARGLIDGGFTGARSPASTEQDMENFGAMEILARRTGGFAFYNTNAIKGSIRQAIDDSRVTYQLGFYPEDVNWDGSFHKLHVKVNRADAHVQTREGYFALPEAKVAGPTWAEMISEIATSPVEATGIRIRAEVGPPHESGEKKLSLLLSLDTAQFQFAQDGGTWNDVVNVAYIQLDEKNRVIETHPLRLPPTIDSETYAQLMKQGMILTRDVQVLPAAAAVQVILRDGGSGKIGSVRIPIAR
jgi:VWFA-related protein